jgi:myosin heavy subunit
LAIIDEECIIPQGTDRTFIDKLAQVCGQNQYFTRPDAMSFQMQHYAGKVISF